MRPALLLVGAALLLSGCGAGGLVTKGDKDAGKKLFQQKCSGCHALAAAGASGTIGPNLDDSFAEARLEGYKESAIADIVAGQIRYPGQYATGSGLDQLRPSFAVAKKQVTNGGSVMPAFKGVLTNAQIVSVAKYVSSHPRK